LLFVATVLQRQKRGPVQALLVGGSNSAGVWGRNPSRRGPTRVRGQSPRRCGDFTAFYTKKCAYFGLYFCL